MSYTDYNQHTVYNKRGKPATIRIDANNNGRVYFSAEAVKLLGLKENFRISFRTYPQDRGIIYFYFHDAGLPLKKVSAVKSNYSLALYCRPLSLALLKHLGFEKDKCKTIRLKGDTAYMPDTAIKAFMILKENIHQPLKWRKKSSYV